MMKESSGGAGGTPHSPNRSKRKNFVRGTDRVRAYLLALCTVLICIAGTAAFSPRVFTIPGWEISLSAAASYAVLGLSVILLACSASTGRSAVMGILAVLFGTSLFSFAVLFGSPLFELAGAAAVLGTVCATAFLVTAVREQLIPLPMLLLFALLSYGGSYLLTGSAALALFSMFPYPPVLFLCHAVSEAVTEDSPSAKRTSTVVRATIGFGLSAGLLAALYVLTTAGHLTMEQVVSAVDSWREPVKELFLLIGEGQIDQDLAEALTSVLFNLIPGTVILILEVLGYFSEALVRNFHTGRLNPSLREFRFCEPVRFPVPEFYLSAISGGLFVVALFLSVFGETGIVSTVAENLMMILFPGMVICGAGSFLRSFRSGGRFRAFPIVLVVFSVVCFGIFSPFLLLSLLAFSGAVGVLLRPLQEKMLRTQEEMMKDPRYKDLFMDPDAHRNDGQNQDDPRDQGNQNDSGHSDRSDDHNDSGDHHNHNDSNKD